MAVWLCIHYNRLETGLVNIASSWTGHFWTPEIPRGPTARWLHDRDCWVINTPCLWLINDSVTAAPKPSCEFLFSHPKTQYEHRSLGYVCLLVSASILYWPRHFTSQKFVHHIFRPKQTVERARKRRKCITRFSILPRVRSPATVAVPSHRRWWESWGVTGTVLPPQRRSLQFFVIVIVQQTSFNCTCQKSIDHDELGSHYPWWMSQKPYV